VNGDWNPEVKKMEHLTEQERKEYREKLASSRPFSLKEWKVFRGEVNKLRGTKTKNPQYAILFINDDKACLDLVGAYYKAKGITYRGISDAVKGLKELITNPPQLIMLDDIMPDISGFKIYEYIKSDPKLKHIPVVMFISWLTSKWIYHSDFKPDGYCCYPFSFRDLDVSINILAKKGNIKIPQMTEQELNERLRENLKPLFSKEEKTMARKEEISKKPKRTKEMDAKAQEYYNKILKYSLGTKKAVERELTHYKEIRFEDISQERIILSYKLLIHCYSDIHRYESLLLTGRVEEFDFRGIEKEIRETYNIPDSIPILFK
jgi:DNA-binding response OmpR family regulator